MTRIDRPTHLLPGLDAIPGIDEEYARRYPYAALSLAITELRGRFDLTQSEFADRLGTTQSVVARLESGRHGIQVSLLNRIAEAFGIRWDLRFTGPGADPEADAPRDVALVSPSGDALLDAFNVANTSSDFVTAHRLAQRIRRDQSSGRRVLAVAIDAYNQHRHRAASERALAAIAMGLPMASEGVARLVAGRSLLALGRPAESLEVLRDAREGLAAATRAEALLDLDRIREAVEVAEDLLETEPPDGLPAARFLAARVYWHANRPFAALSAAAAFHAAKPGEGALIHGAILGYIGDLSGDRDAYLQGMIVLEDASPEVFPDVLRLRAMTAARLGDWVHAFECLERAVESPDGMDRGTAAAVVIEALSRLDDPATLEAAVAQASSRSLIDTGTRRSYLAQARAMQGDFDGAVGVLGLTVESLAEAAPEDQLRCAIALLVGDQAARAFPILLRNESALGVPDGLAVLAKAALEARDMTAARAALDRIAQHDGTAADVARVAIELLTAIGRASMNEVLRHLSITWQVDPARIVDAAIPSAPDSAWEGPQGRGGGPVHEPASLVLERLTRTHVSQAFTH